MSEIERLKEHSQMLGIIGMVVEDFCTEEMTTLDGVRELLAQWHEMKAEDLRRDQS